MLIGLPQILILEIIYEVKNMKKKFMMIIMTLLLSLGLAACGGSGGSTSSVKGTTFDAGKFEVFVPDGWKAFHGADFFGDYEEGYDPHVVNIGKGIEEEYELFSYPLANITYSGEDNPLVKPTKDIYENGKDLEDITTGDYTWEVFTADSLSYPVAVLYTEFDDKQIVVNITLENGGEKVSLEDADILALLAGIKPKE